MTPTGRRAMLLVFALSVVTLGVSAGMVFAGVSIPVVELPRPTGNFAVGTSVMQVKRDLVMQTWYPAESTTSGPRAPYRYGATDLRLRTRLIAQFVRTHAAVDVPVATGHFPVLLYVPSWGGRRSDNTVQAENLASHGFIVIAMDDLYPSQAMDLSTEERYHATLRWAATKARLQAAAATAILDELERIQASADGNRLAGHLDMKRVGMFGFSFGGAVAAETAVLDPRVRAAVDLDGWIFADAADAGVPRPFMIMSSSNDRTPVDATTAYARTFDAQLDANNIQQIHAGFGRYGGYYLTINGTDHYNFSDDALLPSIRHTGIGPLGGRRGNAIIETYLVAFFSHELKGVTAPLLDPIAASGSPAPSRTSVDPAAQLEVWPTRRTGVHAVAQR